MFHNNQKLKRFVFSIGIKNIYRNPFKFWFLEMQKLLFLRICRFGKVEFSRMNGMLLKYTVFFILLVIASNKYINAELPSPQSYPPEYEYIVENEWDNTKKQIESILLYSKLTDVEPELFFDVSYKIVRFSQIKISSIRKEEISIYMLDSVLKILKKDFFLEGSFPNYDEDIETVSDKKRYWEIVSKMLYCYGKTSTIFDHNKFSELWNVFQTKYGNQPYLTAAFKSSLFVTIEYQIKSENILLFLQKIRNATNVNNTEKKRVDKIIELHDYAIISDETLLWKIFWDKNKPNNLNDVFTLDFTNKIYDKILPLVHILPDLEHQVPLDISETCSNLQEKYIFVLFSNILAMNTLLSLEQPSDSFSIFFTKLETTMKKLTNEIRINYPDFLSKKWKDYNQILFDENKIKLKKLKDHYEKKRIEDERLRQRFNSSSNITYESTTVRPEDQGEDFSLLDDAENFKRLTTSEDKYERWKSAKVLGTRFINGQYKPTAAEQQKIDEYVAFLFTQFETDNPGDAGDASAQLQRLWLLAVPGLFQGLKSKDRNTWNAALSHLVRIRNEKIIVDLIKEYEQSNDVEYKSILVDALGKMRTMYDNRFDYRKMMNSKKSKELADKLITPFLASISDTETNEQIKDAVQQAQKFIETPIDSRMHQIDPQTGQQIPIEEPEEPIENNIENQINTNITKESNPESIPDESTLPETNKNVTENRETDKPTSSSTKSFLISITIIIAVLFFIIFILICTFLKVQK
jgi:hypothetical protein